MTAALYSPSDMDVAHDTLGAMCGHGALAAVIGVPVVEAMQHFAKKGWINLPMMTAALGSAGKRWVREERSPEGCDAIILIQFTGPWTAPGVPPRVACRYRHWVATRAGLIWDANWPTWQTQAEWKERSFDLIPPRATGYIVAASLRIL